MVNTVRLTILLLLAGCSTGQGDDRKASAVNGTTIGMHMERLASDDFLGRMPFTAGEERTVNYLKEEFEKLGLMPGNGDSYFQEVPMVEITGTPFGQMLISGQGREFNLDYFTDFMATTRKTRPRISLDHSELVFAGYGIVAPEYGWDDYSGIDWEGKTAVVLVNDPGFRSKDSMLFKGDEMTYYGRWTYKYEEAARQGASGVLIIHETDPAGYGWNVVNASWSGTQLIAENDHPVTEIEGWITSESAVRLFEGTGMELKELRDLARSRDFSPFPLGLDVTLDISNTIRRDVSRNVMALIPGIERADEFIVYMAHWDHLGVGRPVNGDSIYNGAIDNASGTACLLAIAEAFQKSGPTGRSILFLAVTAEEQGLLGSAYYADHPVYDPGKTVAAINMDGLMAIEPMKDLTITGYGQSEMDLYAEKAAQAQGRYIIPDPEPEKGYFFRSDHFNFARIGIPVLYANGSHEGIQHGAEFMKQVAGDYLKLKYHQPSDEFDPGVTPLEGIRFDAQLMYEIGLGLAGEDYFPRWYEDSEFSAARGKD